MKRVKSLHVDRQAECSRSNARKQSPKQVTQCEDSHWLGVICVLVVQLGTAPDAAPSIVNSICPA